MVSWDAVTPSGLTVKEAAEKWAAQNGVNGNVYDAYGSAAALPAWAGAFRSDPSLRPPDGWVAPANNPGTVYAQTLAFQGDDGRGKSSSIEVFQAAQPTAFAPPPPPPAPVAPALAWDPALMGSLEDQSDAAHADFVGQPESFVRPPTIVPEALGGLKGQVSTQSVQALGATAETVAEDRSLFGEVRRRVDAGIYNVGVWEPASLIVPDNLVETFVPVLRLPVADLVKGELTGKRNPAPERTLGVSPSPLDITLSEVILEGLGGTVVGVGTGLGGAVGDTYVEPAVEAVVAKAREATQTAEQRLAAERERRHEIYLPVGGIGQDDTRAFRPATAATYKETADAVKSTIAAPVAALSEMMGGPSSALNPSAPNTSPSIPAFVAPSMVPTVAPEAQVPVALPRPGESFEATVSFLPSPPAPVSPTAALPSSLSAPEVPVQESTKMVLPSLSQLVTEAKQEAAQAEALLRTPAVNSGIDTMPTPVDEVREATQAAWTPSAAQILAGAAGTGALALGAGAAVYATKKRKAKKKAKPAKKARKASGSRKPMKRAKSAKAKVPAKKKAKNKPVKEDRSGRRSTKRTWHGKHVYEDENGRYYVVTNKPFKGARRFVKM